MDPNPPIPATQPPAGVVPPDAVSLAPSTDESPETRAVLFSAAGRREAFPASAVQPFSGRNAALLPSADLRRLRQRHEQYVRALVSRLSLQLRLEFGIQIARLGTLTFQDFKARSNSPTHLVMFRAEPLTGLGVVEMPPRLALLVAERLLGGPGRAPESALDLTEIEILLVDQVIQSIVEEWCWIWKPLQELKPILAGHESQPRFLQCAAPLDALLEVLLTVTVGAFEGEMRLGLPVSLLAPLLTMVRQSATPALPGAPAASLPVAWNTHLNDVLMPLTAEWHGLQLTAGEAARLQPGDVLLLPSGKSGSVRLSAEGRPKFHGRLGTRGRHWAVEVTDVLRT